MQTETLQAAQEILGHEFANMNLLVEALTHASIADSRVVSNERLEFLGDSVLGLVVCQRLFEKFPNLLEGDMTKIKSVAVSRRTCAKITIDLGLIELLKLGKGMQTHAELPASLSAALLEAVIGAIYLDGGLEAAEKFLLPHLDPLIDRAATSGHQQNFKSVLQHVAQERFDISPMYVLLDEKGPDHAKCFEVCVQVGAQRFESSWGQSKKQAEQQAALNALNALGVIVSDDMGEVQVVGGGMNGGENSKEELNGRLGGSAKGVKGADPRANGHVDAKSNGPAAAKSAAKVDKRGSGRTARMAEPSEDAGAEEGASAAAGERPAKPAKRAKSATSVKKKKKKSAKA